MKTNKPTYQLLRLLIKLNIKSANNHPHYGLYHVSSILKELYSDDLVKDLVYKDNPFLRLLSKENKK